jgi:23S rRNA (adenine2503-C2)-methyltransferase
MKKDLKSMTLAEIEDVVVSGNFEKYRAKQIFEKLKKGAMTLDEINIPNKLRDYLAQDYFIAELKVERELISKLDGTRKYLFRLFDDEFIESVLMEYHHGNTLCISTQVGCRMGCKFCASTLGGLVRNLYPSEMLSQIQLAEKTSGKKISNIVMMGIGEPFDNWENVKRFLELLADPTGLQIGARHISLSTSGNVDGIKTLAKEKSQVTLSVSLHAPDDETRNKLMPINKKWNVEELIDAIKYYIKETNRRVSFEYAMIDGVNDTKEHAVKLAKLLKGMLCHVNLIPVNRVKERDFFKSSKENLVNFENILKKSNITVTVRRTLGSDINASCGQLRNENKE